MTWSFWFRSTTTALDGVPLGTVAACDTPAPIPSRATLAATALAILVREVCERAVVISFSDNAKLVPARRGFALREAIQSATSHSSTNTQTALIQAEHEGYDRIIVITDEQSHQTITGPKKGTKGYFINVATNQNGIGYGPWTHLDGWSESVLQYIIAVEAE